jgi:hypothetical protein
MVSILIPCQAGREVGLGLELELGPGLGIWDPSATINLPQIIGPAPRPFLAPALRTTQPQARNKSTYSLSLLP